MIELLTTAEVGELLGVSRARATQLAARADFPKPYARTRGLHRSGVRLWRPSDIERFAQSWERLPGRPRKAA